MHILVINSGSSSIKFSIFDSGSLQSSSTLRCLVDGDLNGIGEATANLHVRGADAKSPLNRRAEVKATTAAIAIRLVLDAICGPQMPVVQAVGYRVVHPGAKLNKHQLITAEVLRDLEEAQAFAPLHDPEALAVIHEGMKRFPGVDHYACFDTVFHQTMPEQATTYPIPESYRDRGVRRYGFHGLSCESIVRQMRAGGAKVPKRMVIAHLGSGCSVTALLDGCSVDNTMGLTPTGGIVMGTRPGDLDPGLMLYLLREQKGDREDAISKIESMFNHESGMVALAGQANDVKLIRKSAANGSSRAILALEVFTRSVTKAIGGYCWLMGGLDAVVFAGGIGEHDMLTRHEILNNVQALGISVDASLNQSSDGGVFRISTSESSTAVFVIPAQEDLMIAVHVDQMARSTACPK